MQNMPPPPSSMQRRRRPNSSQSPISAKSSKKKRAKKTKFWSRAFIVFTVVAGIASIIGILPLFGISTVWSVIQHPTPTITPRPIYTYRGHGSDIVSISWSPDSKRIASSGFDDTVQIWDAATGENAVIRTLSAGDLGPRASGGTVAWSPDGKYISIATPLELLILDAVTSNIVQKHIIHSNPFPMDVIQSFWSPDSRRIAYSSYATVHIWDITSGRDILAFGNPNILGAISALAWSPDGNVIASAEDNFVHIWYAANGRSVFTYKSQSNIVGSMVWSRDSQYIASADDQKLNVWNAYDGFSYNDSNAIRYNFPNLACASELRIMGWSPNNTYLLYACYGLNESKEMIDSWNFPAHKLITLKTLTDSDTGLDAAWSPDGKYLAITSGSTVQVWRVGDLLKD